MASYILALDQGTTSSRAIVFDRAGQIAAKAQHPFPQIYPQAGWVEHDPMTIWDTERLAAAEAIRELPEGSIAGIGVTNQRETTIVWDKATGQPVYNAIVWQCRRTAELCEELKRQGLEERIVSTTGLLIDAYFSGTKIRWILDNVPGARQRAERGELLFGTVETWLIWRLTGQHVTDYSNASRTMLFDIHRLCWDEELCRLLRIPACMLPRPVENSAVYGTVQPGIPGLETLAGVPVCGAAGDQQAALFGQACFHPGEAKNTYGTGCFTLMNVGTEPVRSRAGLVSSVAWSVGGRTTYALEGSVFNGGSTIQWLRDELRLVDSAPECDRLAESVENSGGVVVVPAFTGLGAPYWDMYARGAILGLWYGPGPYRPCGAGVHRLSGDGSDAGHAAGCRVRHHGPAGRRRRQRVGHPHADAGGSAADPGGPPRHGGDHCLRRSIAGGIGLRPVAGYGGAGGPAAQPADVPAPAASGRLRR